MRSLIILTVSALAALALLVGLGTWQMRRLDWKEGLVARVEARVEAPAVPLPAEADWGALAPDDYLYRHVALAGRFLHADEAHVYTLVSEPRGGPSSGPGYWIMTPLEQADGTIVIVNRGFVPLEAKAPATRPQGQVEGTVEIEGLMRPPEEPGLFTPDDEPAENQWFARRPAEIANAHGLSRVAPFFVDAAASAPGGLPQGGETRLDFSNRHLEYAVTWYGLAGALILVYLAFLRQRFAELRRRSGQGRARLL